MKRRVLIIACCVIAIAALTVVVKLIADNSGRNSGVDSTPTPTPGFDEQVDALSEKLDALGWNTYGHFGEFHLSTDSPEDVWGRNEEVQGHIDAITDAIISGN